MHCKWVARCITTWKAEDGLAAWPEDTVRRQLLTANKQDTLAGASCWPIPPSPSTSVQISHNLCISCAVPEPVTGGMIHYREKTGRYTWQNCSTSNDNANSIRSLLHKLILVEHKVQRRTGVLCPLWTTERGISLILRRIKTFSNRQARNKVAHILVLSVKKRLWDIVQ